jgi:nitrogen fixation protein FixH
MNNAGSKRFTGYHMAAILIGFFGIVIAVNIYMATLAIGSFGGTVVDNSYVASQNYNAWLAEADKQAKLGWKVSAYRSAGGRLMLTILDNGVSGSDFNINAKAEHPLGRAPERQLSLISQGEGRYVTRDALPAGRWLVRIEVARGGERYRTVIEVQ